MALLSYASVRDWKSRKVSNWPWAVLGIAGMTLFAFEILQAGDPRAYLILAPIALLFLDVIWDREGNGLQRIATLALYAASASVTALVIAYFPSFASESQPFLRRGLGTLVVILLAHLFYYFGLLRGGADAKAFISIGLLVPGYPTLDAFPLFLPDPGIIGPFEILFPFALTSLMNSSLLLLAIPVLFLVRNLARGDYRWPQVLVGTKVPLASLPPFAWVLQEVREGKVRYYVFPRREPQDANLEGLRSLGIERVWITPQIPFLIPMTIGFVLTFILGNFLFAFL